MMTMMNRRRAMALMGSGAGLALPTTLVEAAAPAVRFDHGVASGDPSPVGAILWTRATPTQGQGGDIALTWHVAPIGGADAVGLHTGRVAARAARDFTAKVEVAGLQPGRDYRYWFETAGGQRSPEGRFRTLPRGRVEELALAVVSCQLYPGGLFNAYDAIARTERLDAVVHLGD